MRAFVQCSLGLVAFAAILSSGALAQPSEGTEEIIVRGGKTLSEYRLELEQAQDDLFDLFNVANEGNDTDVQCRDEAPTGSRMPQRVCRTRAEDKADATGARQFLNALFFGAGRTSGTGEQVNAEKSMGEALGNAMRAGSRALAQFEEEWKRVLGDDPKFYEAVVEYVKLKEEYDLLSGATSAFEQSLQIPSARARPLCEASTLTEYEQRNNVLRVSGTVSISSCPAGTTGSFTLVARVRDDAGETRSLEFRETWDRADTQDHVFSSDYPIGDNVVLAGVSVRGLTCTCADPVP
jgi:hypothetical protein